MEQPDDEINQFRNVERDDVSYIDNASAVLSRGGGKTFSIKSSALSAVSSKKTNIFDARSAS
jgi:hypothetical protein